MNFQMKILIFFKNDMLLLRQNYPFGNLKLKVILNHGVYFLQQSDYILRAQLN